MSLLEQDTIRKERVDEKTVEQLEFEAGGNNKEYKMEGICNSAVYAKESKAGHLLDLYYLVSWKGYPKDENTLEPALAMQHLWKLVSTFHKDYPNKPTATSLLINLAPLMAKPAPPNVNGKRKYGRPVGSMWKKAKY